MAQTTHKIVPFLALNNITLFNVLLYCFIAILDVFGFPCVSTKFPSKSSANAICPGDDVLTNYLKCLAFGHFRVRCVNQSMFFEADHLTLWSYKLASMMTYGQMET